jgi:hypothetical protein
VRAHEGSGLFRGRFLVVYLVLGIIVGVAATAFVVLLTSPERDEESAALWSAWAPTGEIDERVEQITNFVAGRYRLPSGAQLVGVASAAPRIGNTPVTQIAIRRPAGVLETGNPVESFASFGTVTYIMCGFGEGCAIAEGEPSPERLRLVRREVLELALFTFRYVDEATNVVTYLPPPPGEEQSTALILRRDDLETELGRPLRHTLSVTVPSPDTITPAEVETIDRLTGSLVFRFSFEPLPDGTAALVLSDLRLPVEEEQSGEEAPPPADETTTTTQ